MKFYKCSKCGQMVGAIKETACDVFCCGQPMEELVPGTTDAAVEKHVPEFTVNGNIVDVTVGAVEHPMLEEHFIEWIALETEQGAQRKTLKPGDAPKASFAITDDDKVVAVYAYCNLHSLWKAE